MKSVTLTLLTLAILMTGCVTYPPYPPQTLEGWQPHSPDDDAIYVTPYRLGRWNDYYFIELLVEGHPEQVYRGSSFLLPSFRHASPDWIEVRDAISKGPIDLMRWREPRGRRINYAGPPAPKPTAIPDYHAGS